MSLSLTPAVSLDALNSSVFFSTMQEGDFSFSLDSVKVLQQLTDQPRTQNPRLAKTSYFSVCSNPTLPQEFVPLCMQKGATMSFARLGRSLGLLFNLCAINKESINNID